MIQYFRHRSPNTNGGFTLIEILVIVVIVGILASIAAPGWLAFVNNRRISTVRSQAADAIRKAQSDAKSSQTMRALVLDENSDPPRLAVTRCSSPGTTSAATECTLPADLTTLDWQTLGGGDVKRGSVVYTNITKNQSSPVNYIGKNANYPRLVFDGNGVVNRNLSDVPAAVAGSTDPLFIIGFKLAVTANANAQPRCLIVQTLLGGLREGNSKDANECQGL